MLFSGKVSLNPKYHKRPVALNDKIHKVITSLREGINGHQLVGRPATHRLAWHPGSSLGVREVAGERRETKKCYDIGLLSPYKK